MTVPVKQFEATKKSWTRACAPTASDSPLVTLVPKKNLDLGRWRFIMGYGDSFIMTEWNEIRIDCRKCETPFYARQGSSKGKRPMTQ